MFKTIRSFHPNVRARLGIILLGSLMSNMVFPFMSIYLARTIGIGAASGILSIGIIFNFASSFIGGYCADTIGRKKMMLASELLRLTSYLFMLLANIPAINTPFLMVIGFLLSNISSGLFSPASDAMLLDVTSSKDRRLMYSYLYWITNLSMALGGAMGTLLFNHYLVLLCIGLVAASTATLTIIAFRITETHKPSAEQRLNVGIKGNMVQMLHNYSIVWRDRVFMIYIAAFVLLLSLESHFGYYVAVRFEQSVGQFSLDPLNWTFGGIEMFGYLRLENTLLVIVFSILSVKLVKRWTDKGWLFLGMSLYIIGYVGIVWLESPWLLFLLMAAAVMGEAVFAPIYESYLGEIPPKELRSTYLAVNKIALKASTLIGSIGVLFVNLISVQAAATILLLTGVLALILVNYILPGVRSRHEVVNSAASEGKQEASGAV